MSNITTKFYHFSQNNSGGMFDIEPSRGIGVDVWIEAVDADHANSRAEQIGLYFNGVEDGSDCECCGDRWYPTWESNAVSELSEVGGRYTEYYVHTLNNGIIAGKRMH